MKLLVTGAFSLGDDFRKQLEQLGWDVTFHQQEQEPVDCPQQYEGVICNGLFLYQNIQNFIALKFIQLTSAGYDRVPMDYIQSQGIQMFNARGVYSVPMAEFAISGVLQLYKQSKFFAENQRLHRWEKHRDLRELAGQTVCIVGCGSVGQACAKRFGAFDCQVLGVDLYPAETDGFTQVNHLSQLQETIAISDVVVLTLPLTAETKHLFNQETIQQMKPGAVLVNIARGGIVDTSVLIQALQSGHLSGAVLDVFEEEPLSQDSPLWEMEQVILTPHNSFVSPRNVKQLQKHVFQILLKY